VARFISGAVLLSAVIAALWFLQPIYLLGIAVLVALLAFREYLDIAARAGAHVSRPACGIAVALVCVAVGMPGLPIDVALAGVTLGLSALALSSATTAAASGGALQSAAIAVFAPLYIGLPLGLLAATRWTLGREAALLLIVTVAISDSLQYYSGRTFGRHLLAPVVSPKKTIEGAIGGVIAGTVFMIVAGSFEFPERPWPLLAVLGFVMVLLGILGDLFESRLKREANVKDSSSLIPGHGGVLDRIDALLFVAPAYAIALGVVR
jgi:phosphatidate cytidylyltransferase